MTAMSEQSLVERRTLTYDWNGHKDLPISGAHLSDLEVAARVRMLMRTDLTHESTCELARDRIMGLSKEITRLRTALAAAEARIAAPAVKPLEWSSHKNLVGGLKLLAFDCFGNEFARLDVADKNAADIAEFTADAEARYRKRIRSALLPTDLTALDALLAEERKKALEELRNIVMSGTMCQTGDKVCIYFESQDDASRLIDALDKAQEGQQ